MSERLQWRVRTAFGHKIQDLYAISSPRRRKFVGSVIEKFGTTWIAVVRGERQLESESDVEAEVIAWLERYAEAEAGVRQ